MSNLYGGGHGGGGGQGQGGSPLCCFHPQELVVGVCAHCLKERLLLILAAKSNSNAGAGSKTTSTTSSSSISLPKVFALGSFLQRLDSSRQHRPRPRPDDASSDADNTSIASLDDSFISIKFEDNGKATWDSHKAKAKGKTAVVEHVKLRGGVGVTRWRKQVVGRLLQLARWKRSGKPKAGVVLDGKSSTSTSKWRSSSSSWIRSFTRRRHGHADRPWS